MVDWHHLRGLPYLVRAGAGLTRPRDTVLGRDVAGEVIAVGDGATRFAVGDQVLGMSIRTFAERVAVAEAGLVAKGPNPTFEQAAAMPLAALTALQGMRDSGRLRAGQRVLVHGAGGGVGTFAVQIARLLGAEVAASTRPDAVELVRSLGAGQVLDRTTSDLAELGGGFDVILSLGGRRSLRQWSAMLAPEGTLVACGAPHGHWIAPVTSALAGTVRSWLGRQRFVGFLAQRNLQDLEILAGWLNAGDLISVIDSVVPLADLPRGIERIESGEAIGKVVVAAA